MAHDAHLALSLADGRGVTSLVRAFADGSPEARHIVASASANGARDALVTELTATIEALDPARAVALLVELRSAAPSTASACTEAVLASWTTEGRLQAVRPAQALALAGALSADGSMPGVGGRALLARPDFARAIARSPEIPPIWRARAVAADPAAVAPSDLTQSLAREADFAATLLADRRPAVLDAVGAAIHAASPELAATIIEAAGRYVAPPTADEWRWSLIRRSVGAFDRYQWVRALIAEKGADALWTERALDAYAAAIVELGASAQPLPMLDDRVVAGATSPRAKAWRVLHAALSRSPPHLPAALRAVSELDAHDHQAALERVVDEVFAWCLSETEFYRELDVVWHAGAEPPAEHALRMARAAGRPRERAAAIGTLAAVRRIAALISSQLIPLSILDAPELRRLAPVRDEYARAELLATRRVHRKPRALRRWLGDLTSEDAPGRRRARSWR